MATFDKGILGGFSGRVGPVVGSSWKGKDVMRSRPRRRQTESSVKQLDQQLRFSTGLGFLQPMTKLLEVTFKGYATDKTAFNSAFSYTLKNAIGGKTPDYFINYDKALISRGTLPNADAVAATATGKTVYFTWVDNSGIGSASASDQAVVVVYCKALNTAICNWQGPLRSEGAAQVDVSRLAGQTVETWLAFISADGRSVADSIYTGSLDIEK